MTSIIAITGFLFLYLSSHAVVGWLSSSVTKVRSGSVLRSATEHSFVLTVSYEGISSEIPIHGNETILSALERNKAILLGGLDLPSDCRRGNCLTCAASHRPESQVSHVTSHNDGLAPAMSEQLQKRGYVLTCSSHVTGPGVHLDLDQHVRAWQEMYAQRFDEEETKRAARYAMARVIREFAETHVEEWTEETEEIYRTSGEGNSYGEL